MHKRITKKVIETNHPPKARELLLGDTELKGFSVRISKSAYKRIRSLKENLLSKYFLKST